MARGGSGCARRGIAVSEKWRVGHNQVVTPVNFEEGAVDRLNSFGPWRTGDICLQILECVLVDFHRIDGGVGESLSQHERYNSASGAHIADPRTEDIGPGQYSCKDTVGANFHAASAVAYSELLESECDVIVWHDESVDIDS